jgi:nitrogen regulatory protein PII
VFKVVVAYIDAETFEPIREQLVEHGILCMSAMTAGGATPDQFVAPNYRGTPMTMTLAEKLRLECVVGASHADAVKDIILSHKGRRPSFAFIMDVDQVSSVDSVLVDAESAE